MVVYCCVLDCGRKRTSDTEDEFFKFPSNAIQKKKWLEAVQLVKQLSSRSVICSDHFNDNDYKTIRGQRQLKANAVPTHVTKIKKRSTRSNTVISESSRESSRSSSDQEDDADLRVEPSPARRDECPAGVGRVTRSTRAANRLQRTLNDNVNAHTTDNGGTREDRIASKDKDGAVNDSCNSIGSKEDDLERRPKPSQRLCDNTTDSASKKAIDSNQDDNSQENSMDEPLCRIRKSSSRSKSPSEACRTPSKQRNSHSNERKSPSKEQYSPSKERNSPSNQMPSREPTVSAIDHLNSELEKQIEELESSAQVIKNSGKLKVVNDSVHKSNGGSISSESHLEPANSPDCVMMVESVQVDIDPSELMMNDDDDDDDGQVPDDHPEVPVVSLSVSDDKPEDPVSLLTSSDEDDVIVQEPHIDTVEVSDETDEEDVPLKRLANRPKPQPTIDPKRVMNLVDILWGKNDCYCYHCGFSTNDRSYFDRHVLTHSVNQISSVVSQVVGNTVFLCDQCSFQTSSKRTIAKHKKRHKDEKKHKCNICEYRAKHKMSLVYHMKSHQNETVELFKCQECGFGTGEADVMQDHLKKHKQVRITPGKKRKRKKTYSSSSSDEYLPGKRV